MRLSGPIPREARRNVSLPATLRWDGRGYDVTIRNLSARGMRITVHAAVPPPRGTYIDLRRGSLTLTGQVRWRSGDRIGVRLQDTIDHADVARGRRRRPAGAPSLDARPADRPVAERSRSVASAIQFASLAAAPLALASIAGWLAWDHATALVRQLHDALG